MSEEKVPTWIEEMQESVAKLVREGRVSLYRETGRIGREHADAYLAGVQWVATQFGEMLPERELGPVQFVRRFITEIGTPRDMNVPPDLKGSWVRGRNDAVQAMNAAKVAWLKRNRNAV